MQIHLLDKLAEKCGIPFLSNIRYCSDWQTKLSEISLTDEFPVSQWNDAVKYITGKDMVFTASTEALAFLLSPEAKTVADHK